MELLGIGVFELMLIFIIALIVLGPEEMVRVGAMVGRFIRNFRQSEVWRSFQRMSRVVRTLPDDLARQTGLDEIRREIQSSTQSGMSKRPDSPGSPSDLSAWTHIPERLDSNLSPPTTPRQIGDETNRSEPESE